MFWWCKRYNWLKTIEKSNLSFTVWPHESSTFFKKRTRNGHFPRPRETDPYMVTINKLLNKSQFNSFGKTNRCWSGWATWRECVCWLKCSTGQDQVSHFVFVSIVILYLYERGIQTEILSIGLPFLRLVYVLFNFLKRLDKKEITKQRLWMKLGLSSETRLLQT